MRIAVRGFLGMEMKFEERFDSDRVDLAAIAKRHTEMLSPAGALTMIEIEFLDEPNPLERFVRIGPDPGGMVAPIAVKL